MIWGPEGEPSIRLLYGVSEVLTMRPLCGEGTWEAEKREKEGAGTEQR